MPNMRFSEEWDKLKNNISRGEEITTFRAYKPQKDVYYNKLLENKERIHIVLQNKLIATATLVDKQYKWSTDLTLEQIKNDTYQHYTKKDWEILMKKFYGIEKVFGLWLTFRID